jgi:transposase
MVKIGGLKLSMQAAVATPTEGFKGFACGSNGDSPGPPLIGWTDFPDRYPGIAPGIKVADGVAETASVHMRSLIARLRVVTRELQEAERKLDKLRMAIGEAEASSGDCLGRRDKMILKSMHGIGRIKLAALFSEGSGPLSRPDYPALRTLCGVAPVTERSGKSQIAFMRYAAHV